MTKEADVRILVLGGLLLALAGCGAVPEESAEPAGGEREAVLEYADCMRDNGVPDFPDPEVGKDGEASLGLPDGVDPESVDAADKKCKHLMPNGGEPKEVDPEIVAKTRVYAKCMRENGVPKFPDPGADGGIAIEGGPGLDPMSAEFKAAEEKCMKVLPDGGKGSSTNTSRE